MQKSEFLNLIDSQFKRISNLTNSKGDEYSRSEDQLANFKRQAADLDMTKEKVLMVYLNKHLDAIKNHINKIGKPQSKAPSEPISGRIDDAILYLILLQAMVEEDWNSGAPPRTTFPLEVVPTPPAVPTPHTNKNAVIECSTGHRPMGGVLKTPLHNNRIEKGEFEK